MDRFVQVKPENPVSMKAICAGSASRLICAIGLALSLLIPQARGQAPGLSIQLTGGVAHLSITGFVNSFHAVQCATDLSAPDCWQPLTNVLLTATSQVVRTGS